MMAISEKSTGVDLSTASGVKEVRSSEEEGANFGSYFDRITAAKEEKVEEKKRSEAAPVEAKGSPKTGEPKRKEKPNELPENTGSKKLSSKHKCDEEAVEESKKKRSEKSEKKDSSGDLNSIGLHLLKADTDKKAHAPAKNDLSDTVKKTADNSSKEGKMVQEKAERLHLAQENEKGAKLRIVDLRKHGGQHERMLSAEAASKKKHDAKALAKKNAEHSTVIKESALVPGKKVKQQAKGEKSTSALEKQKLTSTTKPTALVKEKTEGMKDRMNSMVHTSHDAADAGKTGDTLSAKGDGGEHNQVMHVHLSPQSDGTARGGAQNVERSAQLLSSRLQQDLSGKIVKQASIVVKSDSAGEIRLILHPENLGSVRIRLQLEDNHIAGRIFVDNTSVRDAFEASLRQLERNFEANGFESAKLNVFVGGDQARGDASSEQAQTPAFHGNRFSAVEAMDANIASADQYNVGEENLINLVV
ncbi:flagellar hook-length control protein FliK [Sediminispirochaeta bajacaliforniensis]|uniref:flagellar hook-length control protein FliK n=1 Tax=Sediminispirochaeta bajacaliforniensis TaxID=148 RepID=UPI00037A7261|nr:flagellar hook-length control protein FliK [Sediminispirochaeta bajacaliforniensis]